jgi:HSP20 family protein
MADTKMSRSQSHQESAHALARGGREPGSLQRGAYSGGRLASPLALMDRMTDEMDTLFSRVFGDFGLGPRSRMRHLFGSANREGLWAPRIEAVQKGDRFIVRAELPGLKKEDVEIELGENALTIHGERRDEREEERDGYYHTEREYGQFYRTVPLPEGVISESAEASFRNGVLEITMKAPPAEATRARRLEIKDEPQGGEHK